jgi:hypothetical protein
MKLKRLKFMTEIKKYAKMKSSKSRRIFTVRRTLTSSPLREVILFRLLFYTESGPQNQIAREKRIRR